MSRRTERVAQLLKEALSEVLLREVCDPRMGFVTVTKVEPSRDLRSAKVFVSILGEETVCRRTMRGIRHAAGFIRGRVGQVVSLRINPELHFVRDDSPKRSVEISRLIAEAVAGDRAGATGPAAPDESASEEPEAS